MLLDLDQYKLADLGAGAHQCVDDLAGLIKGAAGGGGRQLRRDLVEEYVVEPVTEDPRVGLEESLPLTFRGLRAELGLEVE